MHIYPKNFGPIRPETTRTNAPADAPDGAPVRPAAPVPSATDRSDRVEISDAGRALAARDGEAADKAPRPFDAARADQVRQRILSGAYDTLEVVDTVARRLLDSGDV